MIKAYIKFWKKAGDFKSYSSRSDYWWVFLTNFIIYLILSILSLIVMLPKIAEVLSHQEGSSQQELTKQITRLSTNPSGAVLVITIISVLIGLAILVPSISLTARRLRDARFPWWIAIVFGVTSVCGILSLFIHNGILQSLSFLFIIIRLVIYIFCLIPTRYGKDEEDDSRTYE